MNVIVFMVHNIDPTPPLDIMQAAHHVFNAAPLPSDNDHLFLPLAHSWPSNALIWDPTKNTRVLPWRRRVLEPGFPPPFIVCVGDVTPTCAMCFPSGSATRDDLVLTPSSAKTNLSYSLIPSYSLLKPKIRGISCNKLRQVFNWAYGPGIAKACVVGALPPLSMNLLEL